MRLRALFFKHMNLLASYRHVTNYYILNCLKPNTFISPQLLWVRSPGMAYLVSLLRVSQV